MKRLKNSIICFIAFLFVTISICADLRGPYIHGTTTDCPDGMSEVVLFAYDWEIVTVRLLALDGSNAEYTLRTRGLENQAPFVYFLTDGRYKIIEITEGYKIVSNMGDLDLYDTFEFTGGYMNFSKN